ncbi:hypothetical protein AVEN_177783-1, partial [Araneus ventricosus]
MSSPKNDKHLIARTEYKTRLYIVYERLEHVKYVGVKCPITGVEEKIGEYEALALVLFSTSFSGSK